MARVRDRLAQRIREVITLSAYAPSWVSELVTDYVLKAQDIDNLAREIDNLQPITGEGDPNIIVINDVTGIEANRSMIYFNTATNPPEQWFNPTFGSRSGWVRL